MSELQATEIRVGHIVKWEGNICRVDGVEHITPGNWRAIIQLKLRNIKTGGARIQRFSSGDKLELAYIDQQSCEYLYQNGDNYVFMNQDNYEQFEIHKDLIGDDHRWLKENLAVKINFLDGSAIGVDLPPAVVLKVIKTEPALKGATITNVYKPAELETGATVQVPPFIKEGEVIKVDTRSGEYLERVNEEK